jgi:hypothetical protein
MRHAGKLLDKRDLATIEASEGSDLYGVDIDKLRTTFLGKVTAANLKRGTTLLTGPDAEVPVDVAPFLYFYPTLSLQICPHCPQARNPSLIEPFLERGLVSVFMIGRFSDAPRRFQDVAFEYPELFVGPHSYSKYQYYSLNPIDPSEVSHENHYCHQCIHEKLDPHRARLDRLDPGTRDTMGRTLTGILSLPTPSAGKFADMFIKILDNPNPKAARQLRTTVALADYLASAKALGAVPQVGSGFLGKSKLFLRALRIYHPSKIDLAGYLSFVNDFRGMLSQEDVPSSEDDILDRVTRINEEVVKIQTSKRLWIGEFVSRLAYDLPSLFLRVLTQGSYDWEGMKGVSIPHSRSSWPSRVGAKILARYFAVSNLGVRVWQIRKHAATREMRSE